MPDTLHRRRLLRQPGTHDALRSLGAEPVSYGEGMPDRVHAIAPSGVDFALDVAGSGVLPELVELAGAPERVVTVADFAGAQQTGVRFSRGGTGRAAYALAQVAWLAVAGRFAFAIGQTFPLTEVAEAHRVGEAGTGPCAANSSSSPAERRRCPGR